MSFSGQEIQIRKSKKNFYNKFFAIYNDLIQ